MKSTPQPVYLLLALALTLALALAGCGGDKSAPTAQSPAQPTSPPAAPATTPTPQPTPAPQVRPDIPVLADAANLTVTSANGEYAVTYASASGLDAATSFYQAQMPPKGWTYDATVSTQAGGVSQTLVFRNDSEDATVTLSAVGDGVQAIIAVSPRTVAEAAATPTSQPVPTQPSPQPTTPPTEEPTQAPAEAAVGSPDADMNAAVPVMDGATSLVAARDGSDYVVTYQSAARVDEIAAFYQAEMPKRGWTYDASVSSSLPGVSAELHFARADGEAAVSIATTGLGTRVAVAVRGAAADAAEAAASSDNASASNPPPTPAPPPTPTAPPPAAQPAPTQPPPAASTGKRQDIPLMPDAANVDESVTDSYTLTYNSATGVDAIFAFYKNQMPAYGWTFRESGTTLIPGVTGTIYFTKNGEEITITITAQGGVTRVQAVIN